MNLNIYAVNYNVLRIMSGMGGLAYSNWDIPYITLCLVSFIFSYLSYYFKCFYMLNIKNWMLFCNICV
jgi:hypothetical protein